ncbi:MULTISPECIES: VWA domain-containing protein [Rhodococcus]|uniref:VWA domain-containing protein n=1 Tax=Rhodococcus globerulus TaxID=33008 RepID=UPI001C5A1BAD|nr:VWA domain-containing protein [Rhodococcus globerulus]QXW00009.1 VWA domain-containing protein [Rhodococcus globerulus]
MITAVEGLVWELRNIGLPVSVSEHIDAVRVLRHIDLANRTAVKFALASVLVKNNAHESAFSTVFDIYFGVRHAGVSNESATKSTPLEDVEEAELRQLLLGALEREAQPTLLLRLIAAEMISRHAGMQPGRAVAGTYYVFRTLRAVDPNRLLAELIARDCANIDDRLLNRLRRDTFQQRVTTFEQEIEAEIRNFLVADRGADAIAKTLRRPLPEDVEFLTASSKLIEELQPVITPMSRKLTDRLARHGRRSGALDIRRTVRRSMSVGGTPIEPVFRRPRLAKPELYVLADISGSVATFAAFALQLTYALRSEFSRVRSFVFTDGLDEVTSILAESDTISSATQRINEEGLGVWLNGHSDYGNALDTFWQRFGDQINSRSIVLILGDARTNYHAARTGIVGDIRRRAADVFWLNPESKTMWDTGDSIIGQYREHCSGVFECRNIKQLGAFVDQLA